MEVGWSASRPGCFTLMEITPVPTEQSTAEAAVCPESLKNSCREANHYSSDVSPWPIQRTKLHAPSWAGSLGIAIKRKATSIFVCVQHCRFALSEKPKLTFDTHTHNSGASVASISRFRASAMLLSTIRRSEKLECRHPEFLENW